MPINVLLLFVCGVLLGMVLRNRSNGNSGRVQASAARSQASGSATFVPHFHESFSRSAPNAADDLAPQLANLHLALGSIRAPGKAYSAARAAGILR